MKVCGYIVQNLTQNQLNYKKINSRDIPGVYNYIKYMTLSPIRTSFSESGTVCGTYH